MKIRRKTCLQIYIVLNRYQRKSNLGHTAIEFFCSGRHMIETCPKLSCLTAVIRFFCLKGRGSFKKSFKKCGNVEEGKAHRLIPPMTPLLNGWTIPLTCRTVHIHTEYMLFLIRINWKPILFPDTVHFPQTAPSRYIFYQFPVIQVSTFVQYIIQYFLLRFLSNISFKKFNLSNRTSI